MMSKSSNHKVHRHSPCGNLKIDACFDAGRLSPDGGLMLLQEVEKRTNIIADFPNASPISAFRRA